MRWRHLGTTVLIVAAALASVPAINALGGALAPAMGLPSGGTARLAWDLGWLLVSAFVTVWLPARWSPLWPRGLALCLAGLWLGTVAWAVWNMGSDFPPWFVAAALVGAPVMAVAALRMNGSRRTVRP